MNFYCSPETHVLCVTPTFQQPIKISSRFPIHPPSNDPMPTYLTSHYRSWRRSPLTVISMCFQASKYKPQHRKPRTRNRYKLPGDCGLITRPCGHPLTGTPIKTGPRQTPSAGPPQQKMLGMGKTGKVVRQAKYASP